MKTIYKYPIKTTGCQEILMPSGAEPIHAGLDPSGQPCVWAKVDDDRKREIVNIYIVGTGNPMPDDNVAHVGSFVQNCFVWHVFWF
jgi:hypothetical protein